MGDNAEGLNDLALDCGVACTDALHHGRSFLDNRAYYLPSSGRRRMVETVWWRQWRIQEAARQGRRRPRRRKHLSRKPPRSARRGAMSGQHHACNPPGAVRFGSISTVAQRWLTGFIEYDYYG